MIRDYLLVGISLLSAPIFFANGQLHISEFRDRLARLSCIKVPFECPTSGISWGGPVCGYDAWNNALKSFPHRCAMFKENCDLKMVYHQTNMTKCKVKEEFLKAYGNSSVDWHHGKDDIDIPILNLPDPMIIHNVDNHTDFFSMIPGLVKMALPKGKNILRVFNEPEK